MRLVNNTASLFCVRLSTSPMQSVQSMHSEISSILPSSYSVVPLELIIIGSGVAWTATGVFFLVPIHCMNQSAFSGPTEIKVSGTMWLYEPT